MWCNQFWGIIVFQNFHTYPFIYFIALKCFANTQEQQQLPAAAALMSGMPNYLDNFTKIRNSTRNSSHNGGDDEEEREFTLYCITLTCYGNCVHGTQFYAKKLISN
jgi:hypothetical protein